MSIARSFKVLMDADRNRARGVLYIDRITRAPREIQARAIILCAQSQESTRILLNSANSQYPNGLANSSGVLGHYLMAHVRSAGGRGEFPELAPSPSLSAPIKPLGIYIVRFRNMKVNPPFKKFLRGYGFECDSNFDFNWGAPGFGEAYKKAIRDPRAEFSLTGFGEV